MLLVVQQYLLNSIVSLVSNLTSLISTEHSKNIESTKTNTKIPSCFYRFLLFVVAKNRQPLPVHNAYAAPSQMKQQKKVCHCHVMKRIDNRLIKSNDSTRGQRL